MSARLGAEEYEVLRLRVMERDSYKCRVCGYRNNLHCHHVVFRSEMGEDVEWNLLTVCSDCHDKIHRYELFIEVVPPNFVGPNGGADGVLRFTKGEQ